MKFHHSHESAEVNGAFVDGGEEDGHRLPLLSRS